MTQTYEVCELTPRLVRDIFDLCVKNPILRAGICCSSFRQLTEMREIIEEIESESPTWYVDRTLCNINGIEVMFQNDSKLNIFVGNEASRGMRFHYLRVDSATDNNLQQYVLRYLVRDYQFADIIDGNEDNELADLLTFAESMLGQPLHHWQRDILTSMLGGYVCIPSRSIGKTSMLNIFKEWKERPQKHYEILYTYDSLMEGVSV